MHIHLIEDFKNNHDAIGHVPKFQQSGHRQVGSFPYYIQQGVYWTYTRHTIHLVLQKNLVLSTY